MPGFTPNLSIPYPVAADNISVYPALAKQNAEALEALLYDSGWVPVTLADGIVSQSGTAFAVRRIGRVVYPRWGVNSAGIAISGLTVIGTVPQGFRPAFTTFIHAVTSTSYVAQVQISVTGTISLTAFGTASQYYFINTPWLIS